MEHALKVSYLSLLLACDHCIFDRDIVPLHDCNFLISDSRALIGQFLEFLGDELRPIGNGEQRARVRWWRPLGYSTFSGNDGGV